MGPGLEEGSQALAAGGPDTYGRNFHMADVDLKQNGKIRQINRKMDISSQILRHNPFSHPCRQRSVLREEAPQEGGGVGEGSP